MKKKYLMNQNIDLKKSLEKADAEIELLKRKVAERDKRLESMELEYKRIVAKANATQPLKNLEAKVVQAKLDRDAEYGASIIGKIIVEATKCCNALTNNSQALNAKELINLILGRTEVAKAEILKIVSSDAELDRKKEQIDGQFELTIDYFNSIMAQES